MKKEEGEDKTKKKQEKSQILQRSEIQFEVGKKKTFFFGDDTDLKEKVEENGLEKFPDAETRRQVESYKERPQELNSAAKEVEERGMLGKNNPKEIGENLRSKSTRAGEHAKSYFILKDVFTEKKLACHIENQFQE